MCGMVGNLYIVVEEPGWGSGRKKELGVGAGGMIWDLVCRMQPAEAVWWQGGEGSIRCVWAGVVFQAGSRHGGIWGGGIDSPEGHGVGTRDIIQKSAGVVGCNGKGTSRSRCNNAHACKMHVHAKQTQSCSTPTVPPTPKSCLKAVLSPILNHATGATMPCFFW